VAKQTLDVGASEADTRLDRFLAQKFPTLSRRAIALLLEAGLGWVNGRPGRKGDRLEVGDVVAFDPDDAEVVAQPAPAEGVHLVLVTDELIVMDKPAGVPSTAVPGRLAGTAAGQLLSLFPEIATVGYGPREPGLLHRLDTHTSGLLLAARSAEAFTALHEQMRAGAIEKRYLAIVHGTAPREGRVDRALEPDQRNPRRVVTAARADARVTSFRRLDSQYGHSLLEVTLARGYRHQIRAHLASIDLPLVGDVLYGAPPSSLSPRHALHASYIAAESGRLRFRAESALPEDLSTFWSRLAGGTG
jgi:23S rRNA pseudouridine1911/1915/1917 synthase